MKRQRSCFSAMYQIELMPEAIRHLAKLSEKVVAAALETIYNSIAENPQRAGKPLREPFLGLRSARRGDYRIIYAIREASNDVKAEGTVEVYRIAHRKDAYWPASAQNGADAGRTVCPVRAQPHRSSTSERRRIHRDRVTAKVAPSCQMRTTSSHRCDLSIRLQSVSR